MKHDVIVLQLNSEGRSFLNVDPHEPHYGHIAVWTSTYNRPTYLCQREQEVWFIQFDDQQFADEWFKEHCNWDSVIKLDKPEGSEG